MNRYFEALGQYHLEYVAGGDVFLGAQYHLSVFLRRRVRLRRDGKQAVERCGGFLFQRAIERIDDRGQPVDRAVIGDLCRDAIGRADRRHHGNGVFHRIEHHNNRRADQHSVGNTDRVRIRRRQLFHQPHRVVAEIAEDAGRHWRQFLRQVDPAFSYQAAQGGQRRLRTGREQRPRRA